MKRLLRRGNNSGSLCISFPPVELSSLMDSAPTDQAYSGNGTASLYMPGRVDLCLPGRANQILPVPLDRVYNVEEMKLRSDCFDFLNYGGF
jgi:hypothetical protein